MDRVINLLSDEDRIRYQSNRDFYINKLIEYYTILSEPALTEQELEDRRNRLLFYKSKLDKSYDYFKKFFKEKGLDYNRALKEFEEEVSHSVSSRMLKKLVYLGGKDKEGQSAILEQFKREKRNVNNIYDIIEFISKYKLDTRLGKNTAILGLDSFSKDWYNKAVEEPNIINVLNYRVEKNVWENLDELKKFKQMPIATLIKTIPDLGITRSVIKSLTYDIVVLSLLNAGRINKDDYAKYLSGDLKFSDIWDKAFGLEDAEIAYSEVLRKEPANPYLLLEGLSEEEKKKRMETEEFKKNADVYKDWQEKLKNVKRDFLTKTIMSSIGSSYIKLGAEISSFLSDVVVYNIFLKFLGKPFTSVSDNVLNIVNSGKLVRLEHTGILPPITGEVVKPTVEKFSEKLLGDISKNRIKFAKKLEEDMLKKGKIIYDDFKWLKETQMLEDVFSLNYLINRENKIYKSIKKVLDKNNLTYDAVNHMYVLKGNVDEISKSLTREFDKLSVIQSYKMFYEDKLFKYFGGLTPKQWDETMKFYKEWFKVPKDHLVEGQLLALSVLRNNAMSLGVSVGDKTVRDLFKVYLPNTIKDIKKLDEMLREKVVIPRKDIAAKTAKELGFRIDNIPVQETGIKILDNLMNKIAKGYVWFDNKVVADLWDKTPILRSVIGEFIERVGYMKDFVASTFYSFISPNNFVLDKQANKIINYALYNHLQKEVFKKNYINKFKELYKNVGIKIDGPEDRLIYKLLHQYVKWEDIPVDIQQKYSHLKDIFNEYRKFYNVLAEAQHYLNINYLGAGHRIPAYAFIDWTDSQLRHNVSMVIDMLRKKKEKGLLLSNEEDLLNKLRDVKLAIDAGDYEKFKNLVPYLPISVKIPHIKKRTIGYIDEVMDVSSFNMMAKYLENVSRFMFDQPVLQYYKLNNHLIKNDFAKKYVNWYIKNLFGYTERVSKLSSILTGFQYLSGLGFNIRSAIVNSTQNINTFIELGPDAHKYMAKAFKSIVARDDIFNQALKYFPYSEQLQGLKTMMRTTIPILDNLEDAAYYLFSKVELTNKMMSYFSAYHKAIDMGNKIPRVADLLKKGYTLQEAAARYAVDVMKDTQFVYGLTGMPKIFYSSLLRPILTFSTFPIKQTELFVKWAKENPVKLVSYLVVGNKLLDTFDNMGLDLYNAVSLGIDIDMLIKGLNELGTDHERAKTLFGIATDDLLRGSGVLPNPIPPGYTMLKNIITTLQMSDISDIKDVLHFPLILSVPLKKAVYGVEALERGPRPAVRFDIRNIREVILTGEEPKYEKDEGLFYIVWDYRNKPKYMFTINELLNYILGFMPPHLRYEYNLTTTEEYLRKERSRLTNNVIKEIKNMLEIKNKIKEVKNKEQNIEYLNNLEDVRKRIMESMYNFYQHGPTEKEKDAFIRKIKQSLGEEVRFIKDEFKRHIDYLLLNYRFNSERYNTYKQLLKDFGLLDKDEEFDLDKSVSSYYKLEE